MKKTNQSVLDSLISIIPGLKDRIKSNKTFIDSKIASNLFLIWKKSFNKRNENTYKRPSFMSAYDIDNIKKSGLIRVIGENIEITDKGKDVI